MDVVLVNPPLYKRTANKRAQPQLGLAYIAGYLLSAGVEVKIVDALNRNISVQQVVDEVAALSPLVVGVTAVTEDRFNAIELINRIKSRLKDSLVIAGGPHFSYSAEDAISHVPGLDAVVIGEGELTCLELVDDFQRNRSPQSFHSVHGCAFRNEAGDVVVTPRRPVVGDLDALADPAWDLFDMSLYQGTLSAEEQTRAVGVISSRGCPNNCVFCANSLSGRLRFRSMNRFVDEVELLHKKYGFPGLNFQDDSFTASKRHVTAICHEILERKLRLRWYCSLRVNNVTKDLLALMKEAGCVALGYGIESGSDHVLEKIEKGITTAQIANALKWSKELRFQHISLFLMTSLPGQTRDDIRQGSLFLHRMYTRILGQSKRKQAYLGIPTYVYPGTVVEALALKNGNVFAPGFSWNTCYETDRSKVLDSNPYVPHFENPDLSLEEIRDYAIELNRKWEPLIRRAWRYLPGGVRSTLKRFIIQPLRELFKGT